MRKSEKVLLLAGGVLLTAGVAMAFTLAAELRDTAKVVRWLGIALWMLVAARRRSLSWWILVAMAAGVELGFDAPAVAVSMRFLSDIFFRLIKLIVAPLIFATLVTGIAGHGDLKGVGRIGIKSLVYFEIVTTLALVIGLAAINMTQAGVGLKMAAYTGETVPSADPMHWQDFLVHVVPENVAKPVAEGQLLQVAAFAILFGISLSMLSEEKRAPMLRLTESLSETMFRFTNIVMYVAPIGVGAAMAYTIGQQGPGVLVSMGKLLATIYGALIAFALLVLWPSALLFRVPMRRFLRAVAEPATIAFATSTSEAALPSAMESMESIGVPRRIVSFVIPLGYSFNLTGSTLYLAAASLFVAQAAGVHLSLGQQLMLMGTMILTSKGIAGVPRAVIVVLLATASSLHLPTEPILVILGIDWLANMARTVVNVTGNCLASVIVAKWEGELGEEAGTRAMLEEVTG
jgi:proton glutamate symport protein